MVRAVVAERKPRRRRADRAAHELVAEADPEDRQGPLRAALRRGVEEGSGGRRDVRDRGGIPGPVRDDDPVRRPREDVARGRRRGEHAHRRAVAHEAPDLVLLHSGVEERDLRTAARLAGEPGGLDDERLGGEWRRRLRLRDGLARDVGILRSMGRHLQDRAAERSFRA